MKKKIIALATAAMCMTGSINTVFASTFADINDVPWPEAAKYIDEAASLGLMAGYTENGKKLCKARNNVTYNEAMQLVYQIMCSYNSANKASASVISKWTSTMKNANIPSWAYECVAYGLENSILSSNDLKIFMSSSTEQRNATREDVGVIFGKALSKVYTVNQSAALKYNDKNAITASSVPYLELLNRLNLMVGDANNNFNPKANINRAEMAVLSTKTYKELKGTGSGGNTGGPVVNEQIVGEVTKISDDSITVKTTAGEKTAKIDSKVSVMYEGDKGEVADINEGDSVVVNNGTATFITAYSSGTSSNIKEGTITSISKTRITIENGSKKATYKFDDDYNDVTLKLDGKTSKDIDDLIELVKDGENIEAEITADKNGYVTKITAETVEKKALEGTVTGLTSSKITIKEKPKGYVDKEDVYALAQKVVDQITNDSMTDMEKAFAIYRWTKTNIGYTGTSNKDSWTIGAYQAFTKKSGDCFNYYAAAKAMLDVCGIQNVDIVKSDTSHSAHYWSLINLGDGWYHFDATPRKGGGNFFMLTDAELAAYSTKHKNSHIFDSSLYPERATVSVQDKINYAKGTINK